MSTANTARVIVQSWLKYILPLFVIAGGLVTAKGLIDSAEEPEKRDRPDTGTLVEVVTLPTDPQRIDVLAHGTVVPAREVVLQPQASGLVEWQSPNLTTGATVSEGDELVRLEQREYRLRLNQARAELEQARSLVELEGGRRNIAEREFELFSEEIPNDGSERSLALREPQRQEAEARVEGAEARVALARLSYNRTTVSAPFNAVVMSESVDLGQLVGPQSRLATLVGSDEYWIQVSIPVDDVSRIDIPGVNGVTASSATVRQDLGDRTVEWEGRVVRLLGDVDPVGRMARVLLAVDDPLHLLQEGRSESSFPLLLGSFVEVSIHGRTVRNMVELPRQYLHEGNRVYLMSPDGSLEIREVTIAWRRPETVLISSGLDSTSQIITSHVGIAVPGMAVRTRDSSAEGDGVASQEASQAGEER